MEYLLVFTYGEYSTSFGNTKARFNNVPPTYSDILSAQNTIREQRGLDKVTIINWLPLSSENIV